MFLIVTFAHYLLMIDGRKNSLKYTYAWFLCLSLFLTFDGSANYTFENYFLNTLTIYQDTGSFRTTTRDTIPVSKDSVAVNDTVNVQVSKDSLDSPISYSASDSMVLSIPDKRIILFSKAQVKKDDMDLTADSIELNQENRLVVATFRRDSLGNIIGRPRMIQGESNMSSDVIRYNFQTQKGITQNTFTQQGEMYVQGEKMKKISVSEFFAYRGQFTTCNLDTPHFAFRAQKMKIINQKLAVSGPIHPEFEGVPVPIYLPFGFFPISQGRHSGLIAPQFTASEQFGIGLQGLGYYKVLSDYFDVTLRGDIYSYGGWAMYLSPTYRKRYRYNGGMNFTLQKTRILSTDPKEEFSATQTFNIMWSHTVDSKARPGQSFSANVNAGSTKFNRLLIGNPMRNFQNQMNSSITYSKTWDSRYNLTLSANHNQNNNNGIINLNLPNLAFTANTVYPFQPKDFVGETKWYQKLGIGLNTNFVNQISFYDSLFSMRKILDTMQWGAQHNIPIQVALPPLGPIQIAPGVSFQERWYSQKFARSWNNVRNKVDTTLTKGFFASRDVSFSLSMNTAIFGLFDNFGKKSNIRAIRHVIRPSFSLSYKPDITAKDFYRTQIDTSGRTDRFSYYDGSLFGPFSSGEFGGIGFGIDNNIEMKVRDKNDTTAGATKKIRLIDGFGVNGGYNLMADSFKLTNLNFYLRSTLFEIVNITAGATLDPYQVDERGYRRNAFAWQSGKFSPGRVVNGNVAISTSFKSKARDENKAKEEDREDDDYLPPLTMDEQMAQLDYVRQNPAEFTDFNIPWSVNLSYSMSFFRNFKPDYSGFETITNSTVSVNGDFSLTPRWKVGMNTFYDLKQSQIQTLTMFISREMHCWQLSINVTPVGIYRSFNITINPKSGLLRDLRVNRTRYFYGM